MIYKENKEKSYPEIQKNLDDEQDS